MLFSLFNLSGEAAMKTITNTFLKGLLFSLPILITFGLIYWVFVTAEQMLRVPLEWLLPEGWYITGMGLLSTFGIVFALGVLAQAYLIEKLFVWFELLMEKIPFVKTVYTSARDLLGFLTGSNEHDMQSVVAVEVNGMRMIGFVTNEHIALGENTDQVAVYIPMSYMIGGFLVYMDKEKCTPLDIPVQKAMQQVITAHINHSDSSMDSAEK
ncbi:DUF502 domain-containing protein [Aurantivibrio plasticivorans]